MIEHFFPYFQENYGISPTFFVGTLQQAVAEALNPDSVRNVFVLFCTDDEPRLWIIVATHTADLHSPWEKSLRSPFLFGDLLQRGVNQLPAEELHCLAMGCHFREEQRQVNDDAQNELNYFSLDQITDMVAWDLSSLRVGLLWLWTVSYADWHHDKHVGETGHILSIWVHIESLAMRWPLATHWSKSNSRERRPDIACL